MQKFQVKKYSFGNSIRRKTPESQTSSSDISRNYSGKDIPQFLRSKVEMNLQRGKNCKRVLLQICSQVSVKKIFLEMSG